MPKFTHLHTHSHYSLLDGLPKIPDLIDCVKDLGMDSVALTDHGVLYGTVEFFKEAKAKGVKPIIGCEVYMAFEKYTDKRPNIDSKNYHMILLAKNQKGYQNLVKLVTKAHLEGYYYKPRIDEELLEQHAEGLIGTSACINGKIPKLLLANKLKEAEALALRYQKLFGKDSFYFELQHHQSIPEQATVNKKLIELSKKTGIPLIATNDIHYLRPEDAEAQDILMLINTGADPNDPERLSLKSDDFSMLSMETMAKHFKDVPEAIENTQKVVELCNFEFELGKTHLPHFNVPGEKTAEEYLTQISKEGLRKRFGETITQEIKERLDYELSVINKTGFSSYILIVQDFVNWAKQNRIVVGPGRGSAGGSLVCYATNITNVNPLKYDLLFERFLNPERIAMPDIDIDFTDRRRDEVLKYVADKYGHDKVAQIITFGTMASRAVIRDVGRALGYSYSYCDTLAKMVPFGMDLSETLEKVSEFKDLYDTDPMAKKLIDLALKLEGVARHASTHACGVVISEVPLDELVPLQYPPGQETNIVTQYEMHAIEDLGLLKMDFLGLKNLTIIEDTLARIYVIRNEKIDIENISFEDKTTYKLLQDALTTSVFQLESDGMKRYLKDLKPTEFEDIIAMVALYRPGPMQFIPDYIERKHGKQRIEYIHEKLEPILKNTYGIMIYQEQLMKLAQDIAGFTLGEADVLRKAVGKKIKSLLDAQEKKFIEGCVKNGTSKKIAEELWQWILPFAAYGFNKCLSGDTEIINAKSGKKIKIKDLYQDKSLVRSTFSLNQENNKIKISKINGVYFNGKKPTYEVTTRSGRKITATSNHPFLTAQGWKNLEQINTGQVIAVPRSLPQPKNEISVENYKIATLGYLLSEGNLCHPHGFYFYSKSKDEIEDYIFNLEKFKNVKATIDHSKSAISVYSKRKNQKEKSEALEWLGQLGLRNKKATEKFFPEFVFQLTNDQLALLIGKMFQGDGCINIKGEYPQIFYATSSYDIATGLQHLLLRLGILSTIHTKQFKYRGKVKVGYTININRHDNIEKFGKAISPHLLKNKRYVLEYILKNHPIINGKLKKWSARGSKDIIPVEIIRPMLREAVMARNISYKEVAIKNDFSERLLWIGHKKIGYLRETVQYISEKLKIRALETLYNSDIFWDKITSINYIGEQETFDLEIEGTHNFIANNIFVHNSHSAAYATISYQTAYLKAHYPVEFMASVLTSEKTDVERIALLIEECKKMDIEVLPPNINESLKNFTVVPNERKIRFGLLAIKNVGENIIDAVVEERKTNGQFKSMSDFINRVQSKDLNKKSMEALIKAGAFDQFAERNQLLQNLERLLEIARENQKNKSTGQIGLFASAAAYVPKEIRMEPAEPAKLLEKLTWEKELLGLYVSSHPLNGFRKVFESRTIAISKIDKSMINKKVLLGGLINSVKKIITKNGKPMLFIKFEDLTAKTEIVVFPNLLERNPNTLQENKVVFFAGRVDDRNGEIKIIADDVQEILNQES